MVSSITADEVVLRTREGQTLRCENIRLDSDAVKPSGKPDVVLPWSDVLDVRLAETARSRSSGAAVIETVAGDRWLVRIVKSENEALVVHWPGQPAWGTVAIPLEQIRHVVVSPPTSREVGQRLMRHLWSSTEKTDQVWLDNQDRLSGEFVSWEGAFLEWKSAGKTEKLPPARCRAVSFNPELLATAQPPLRRWMTTLIDGSTLAITAMTAQPDGKLRLTTQCGPVITVPMSALSEVRYFSERTIPVSALTPKSVEFTPYLSQQRTPRLNRNQLDEPLAVRGRVFPLGLGCYSQMRITYELSPQDRIFQSAVGIDDAANGQGHVVFGVDVDGKRRWTSSPITGRDPLIESPRIPVAGAKELSLTVEFGAWADVADFANWCDPVLLRDAGPSTKDSAGGKKSP